MPDWHIQYFHFVCVFKTPIRSPNNSASSSNTVASRTTSLSWVLSYLAKDDWKAVKKVGIHMIHLIPGDFFLPMKMISNSIMYLLLKGNGVSPSDSCCKNWQAMKASADAEQIESANILPELLFLLVFWLQHCPEFKQFAPGPFSPKSSWF